MGKSAAWPGTCVCRSIRSPHPVTDIVQPTLLLANALPLGPAADCTWGERPIAWLTDLLLTLTTTADPRWTTLLPPRTGTQTSAPNARRISEAARGVTIGVRVTRDERFGAPQLHAEPLLRIPCCTSAPSSAPSLAVDDVDDLDVPAVGYLALKRQSHLFRDAARPGVGRRMDARTSSASSWSNA